MRTHEEMKEVLLFPEASGPHSHYFMIRGGSEKGNITVWEAGTVGGEYIKTFGHYHVDALPETYLILSGRGVAILQKRKEGSDDELEDVRVVPLVQGDELHIPAGYGHMVANTGTGFLVTKDDSPVAGIGDSASFPTHADYEPVRRMGGFAYFVVEREGKSALVKNPRYRAIEKEDQGGLPIVQ